MDIPPVPSKEENANILSCVSIHINKLYSNSNYFIVLLTQKLSMWTCLRKQERKNQRAFVMQYSLFSTFLYRVLENAFWWFGRLLFILKWLSSIEIVNFRFHLLWNCIFQLLSMTSSGKMWSTMSVK